MNVFDILGPIMIGPSSSHTAGAARIGLITRALLDAPAVAADIILYGSFAKTYKGHGTDKAIVAGDLDDVHPNTAFVSLTSRDGHEVSLPGSSIGGGNILITKINGMEVSLSGQQTTLIVLHRDAPGTIASVTELMAEKGVNICNFHLSRKIKGGQAVMTIEIDGRFGPELNTEIQKLANIYSSTMLQPI